MLEMIKGCKVINIQRSLTIFKSNQIAPYILFIIYNQEYLNPNERRKIIESNARMTEMSELFATYFIGILIKNAPVRNYEQLRQMKYRKSLKINLSQAYKIKKNGIKIQKVKQKLKIALFCGAGL